jgi:hypothetical protein
MDLAEGSNEPDGYALGVIEPGARKLDASDPSLTFNMIHQLTESEWSQFDEAIVAVNRLDSPFHYKLVERDFLQLRDIHQFVLITISLGKDFASGDRRLQVESVMTATVNWLSSMRMFLDHEETDLKHRFGRASAEIDAFSDVTSGEEPARLVAMMKPGLSPRKAGDRSQPVFVQGDVAAWFDRADRPRSAVALRAGHL